ncbi:MAG TPA: hypothetical protein VMI72_04450 [Roseiarcus sp.]|nr:hypothetical protein [Roseiarcus sp.]
MRYAGVPISRDRKLGDPSLPHFLLPHNVADIPDYEEALLRGIRMHVRPGDRVVVVGGGEGVTVAVAAKAVRDSGRVICFEGAKLFANRVRTTAKRNGLSKIIDVRHAIVGESISVYGDATLHSSEIVDPRELPECDVLELDCEGAEIKIISTMTIKPRVVLVETHGGFGSPTEKVKELLETKGYDVEDLGWAEPDRLEECKLMDVRVLAAVQAWGPR